MEKKCSKCLIIKNYDAFHKSKKDGYFSYCKECRKIYDREKYPKIKQKKKENAKIRSIKIRKWLDDFKKEQKCKNCNLSDFRVLDYHHKNSDKEFNIGDSIRLGYSLEKIKNELAKCECLCSNCHRIKTYEDRITACCSGLQACMTRRKSWFDSKCGD